MHTRFAIAAFLSLVPANVPAATGPTAPQTRCNGANGREFAGYIIPDVPLVGGIRTGMSKEQVKRLAPKLSLFESRQRLELFPGLSFRATVMFNNWMSGVEWLRLFGSWRDTPTKQLTAHYGEPIELALSNSPQDRRRVLKWCDGQRVFVLTERSDDFILMVTSERLYSKPPVAGAARRQGAEAQPAASRMP